MAADIDVRADITPGDVTAALRAGLGPAYHVLPAHQIDQGPVIDPQPGPADTIVVGTGSNRYRRAQVTVVRDAGRTTLHVRPGGVPGVWIGIFRLINRLTIAPKTRKVLRSATALR